MSQSGESVVRDVFRRQLQAHALVDGAAEIVDACFYPLLLEEAESTAVDSTPFAVKLSLLSMLLTTLRPAHCYETRQALLRPIADVLPQLTMALLASSLDKTAVSLFLMDVENLHKRLIIAVADADLTAIIDDAVVADAEKKRERAGHYVGHWIDWYPSGNVLSNNAQRCQVAAFQPHLDQFMLVTVSGKKLAELRFDAFEAAVNSGAIVVLERIDKFDQTLAAVIDGMRQP